jgi:hypothetical protein
MSISPSASTMMVARAGREREGTLVMIKKLHVGDARCQFTLARCEKNQIAANADPDSGVAEQKPDMGVHSISLLEFRVSQYVFLPVHPGAL